MPIRRKADPAPKDVAPSDGPGAEETANEEVAESAPPAEEVEGEVNGEGETVEGDEKTEGGETDAKVDEEKMQEVGGEEEKKEEKDDGEEKKERKVKRTIPVWATVSASKRVKTQGGLGLYGHAKLDHILLEAIRASKDRNGASINAVMKYITNKYVALDLDQRKFHLRKALKRLIDKGMVKQLKGKGFSGSFAIGKLPPRAASDKPVVAPGVKAETLGDTLPLIITRLCEPKEASYTLIKKYLEQHFPKLNVECRPEVLKMALQKAVDKGHLEQITGKGASGTFQVKRFGDKELLKGGALEGAILTAITAMNEPKSCSTTLLRKFLVETHKDSKAYMLVNNLKRTLNRCKMMGWMEQVTGTGLNGTYQLCYPYYPSPAILFPEKQTQESEEEDSEEEEDDDESDYEAPPKRRLSAHQRLRGGRPPPTKRPAATVRRSAPPPKKPKPSAKKVAPPAKPPKADSRAPSRKSRAAKKATPTSKTKTPVAKKATPTSKTKTPVAKKATPTSKIKTPVAKTAIPTSKTKTPVTNKATPTSKTKTPVAKKTTPTSKTKTPVAKKMTSRASKRAAPKTSAPIQPTRKSVRSTK
ncbi:heterochromatin protein 1-binding protein 3-like isoform X1 [Anguilla anguilla]|uniref:heterochromatin protein 1-binding protein 3-like isoform X1 n=1 Tax=Anguilla anguilla TaxID=7936 RepID=UPI0015B0EFA1|nr:heterochromatin protein 1-binding protein 3-like isoform X1 [Anguilla anguilla]